MSKQKQERRVNIVCVCGHGEDMHRGKFGCWAYVPNEHDGDVHVCECAKFIEQPTLEEVQQAEQEIKQDDFIARMRVGGVPLGELMSAFYGAGEELATTLNGLNMLNVGVAQPIQEHIAEDEQVWDGVFVWSESNMMHYMGRTAPGGLGKPIEQVLDNDWPIHLF